MLPSQLTSRSTYRIPRQGRRNARITACGARLRARCFSLLEMVIVLAAIALFLALVLPRTGRMPRRLVLESTLSGVRSAFRDAGLRARAQGVPIRLALDVEEGFFRIKGTAAAQSQTPAAASVPGGEDAARREGLLKRVGNYKLPRGVEWDLSSVPDDDGEGPGFSFFPDGAAAGAAVEFAVGKSRYRLDVDRLTGRPIIEEL